MGFESSVFLSMMPSTLLRSTRAGATAYGAPVYSTSVTRIRGRIVDKQGFVRNKEGEDIAYRTVAWIASTGWVDQSDRFTLPDGTSPPIVGVERYPDPDGTHHNKVMFGW